MGGEGGERRGEESTCVAKPTLKASRIDSDSDENDVGHAISGICEKEGKRHSKVSVCVMQLRLWRGRVLGGEVVEVRGGRGRRCSPSW